MIKHDNGKSAKLEKKNPRKGFILALMFNQTVLISVSITFNQLEVGANINEQNVLHSLQKIRNVMFNSNCMVGGGGCIRHFLSKSSITQKMNKDASLKYLCKM